MSLLQNLVTVAHLEPRPVKRPIVLRKGSGTSKKKTNFHQKKVITFLSFYIILVIKIYLGLCCKIRLIWAQQKFRDVSLFEALQTTGLDCLDGLGRLAKI